MLGSWTQAMDLLALDEIPDVPLDPDTLSRDPAVGAAYAADELVWHGPFKRTTLESLGAALETIARRPAAGRPAHAVGARRGGPAGPVGPRARAWRAWAGDLARDVFPGARHEVFNETNQDEVIGEVADFIDEVAPA